MYTEHSSMDIFQTLLRPQTGKKATCHKHVKRWAHLSKDYSKYIQKIHKQDFQVSTALSFICTVKKVDHWKMKPHEWKKESHQRFSADWMATIHPNYFWVYQLLSNFWWETSADIWEYCFLKNPTIWRHDCHKRKFLSSGKCSNSWNQLQIRMSSESVHRPQSMKGSKEEF